MAVSVDSINFSLGFAGTIPFTLSASNKQSQLIHEHIDCLVGWVQYRAPVQRQKK